MSLIQTIKAAQLQARKDRMSDRASLLTTIIGEADMVGKNKRNGEPTDDEVIKILKKFASNNEESIGHMNKQGVPASAMMYLYEEQGIIAEFLPEKLSDEVVAADIRATITEMNLPLEVRSMGPLTSKLKTKYGEQFDGAQVSMAFKAHLREMGVV